MKIRIYKWFNVTLATKKLLLKGLKKAPVVKVISLNWSGSAIRSTQSPHNQSTTCDSHTHARHREAAKTNTRKPNILEKKENSI